MRHLAIIGSITILFAACSDTGGSSGPLTSLAGTWRGTIDTGGTSIEMIFHISETDAGVQVTLDVPAQGAENLPVRTLALEGQTVTMNAPLLGATYTGELSENGESIRGTWEQNGVEVPLALSRGDAQGAAAERSRPQTPEPPFPYSTEDLTFTNPDGDISFGATVSYPSGQGPFPGLVLISGSGQQDRNHEILGHQTFAVLADRLTRAGFAVLRYDDRGVGESGGGDSLSQATSESFARDVLAAYRRLSELSYVDPTRVGLAGLSEGGSIAPMVVELLRDGAIGSDASSRLPVPAFLVLLGASAVPGDELMMAQSRALLQASGAGEEQIQAAATANRQVYDIVLSERSAQEAGEEIRDVMQGLGMSGSQIDAQVAALMSPWYRAFLRYNPAPALRELTQPVLALYGSLDRQVPPGVNAPAMQAALEAAPVEQYRVQVIDGVNHLLQPAETGSTSEYGQIETTVAESVLDAITAWLGEVVQ